MTSLTLRDLGFVAATNSGGPSDPHFANVSLLLHMDGSNGSTVFIDSSASAFPITVQGSSQITTTGPKFGTGALLLDGSYDWLQTPSNAAFNLSGAAYTVECWASASASQNNNGLFTFGGQSSGLAVSILGGTGWYATNSGSGGYLMGPVTPNQWQHIAVCSDGAIMRTFINGVQGQSPPNALGLNDNTLKIGYYYDNAYAINAKIDEFRVTKGIARYTSNFTPPTAPFPDR